MNDKDATAHPNQRTENNTENHLSKMLAKLSDAQFTDDDSLETIDHIFIKNNLDLHVFSHRCYKFNKEIPQIKAEPQIIKFCCIFHSSTRMGVSSCFLLKHDHRRNNIILLRGFRKYNDHRQRNDDEIRAMCSR